MANMNCEEIRQAILEGKAEPGLHVEGTLNFTKAPTLKALPADLSVRRLILDDCTSLETLPSRLNCYELSLRNTSIQALPADIHVEYRLDLSDCAGLEALPDGLKVGSLVLRNCTSLRHLPENLDVYFLDISNCHSLESLPSHGQLRGGKLIARNCTGLRTLPRWLGQLAELNLSGCSSLGDLPDGLYVSAWLDVANTQITALPPSLSGVPLRWRDVWIDERIAFHPETLSAQDILQESNAELRRVMMDRKGYSAFMEEAKAQILDQDSDPGGERRLLRVPIQGDEALVSLSVYCPSTGRQYLLRVPPTILTCHQAAAWIAGFDKADEYHPLIET